MRTNRTKDRLRLPLAIAAGYALAVGVVQLVPPLAEAVFARPVVDPAVESLAGTLLLTLGGLYALLAADPRRPRVLVWIAVAGSLLNAANLAYYWTLGAYGAQTVLAPILLDLTLGGWLTVALVHGRDARPVMPARD